MSRWGGSVELRVSGTSRMPQEKREETLAEWRAGNVAACGWCAQSVSLRPAGRGPSHRWQVLGCVPPRSVLGTQEEATPVPNQGKREEQESLSTYCL